MQEHELNVAARLAALEAITAQIGAMILVLHNVSDESASEWLRRANEGLRDRPVPGLSPEMSDHMSALYHEAVTELLGQISNLATQTRSSIAARRR